MTHPTDDRLLVFLEGSMEEPERSDLLDQLDGSPELAARLRDAAAGLDAVRNLAARGDVAVAGAGPRRSTDPRWWVAAAAAAVIVSVPSTWWIARATADRGVETIVAGRPVSPEPTFVLILHGRWPDAAVVEASEAQRRAQEYWGWTSALATEGVLVAAGDLRWEPGERLGPTGVAVPVVASELERADFVVGMFALRVDSYQEALAVAQDCPHLRYGGSVSVRQVGAGFVTVDGRGDWSDGGSGP